jgi:pimeloyl-ACP methyl ester carboxylesterase
VPSIGNGLHGPQLPHAPAPSLVNVSMPSHLMGLLDCPQNGTIHLVTHSLGSLIGRHLRRALGSRVTRMTLIEPVIVSVLRERHGDAAHAEMEEQYQRFMSLSDDHEAAAAFFVNHWSGAGAWESMGERGRDQSGNCVTPEKAVCCGQEFYIRGVSWLLFAPGLPRKYEQISGATRQSVKIIGS